MYQEKTARELVIHSSYEGHIMLWGPHGKTLGRGNRGQEPSVASSGRNGQGGKVGFRSTKSE